ncbi:hypothetical protein COCSUDRAFT_34025 [Coccomyxa subellipsoidea C-169]|uniref:Uncharacterized protein n=1 Tax=Coccomyxa subellipsoidea (strain C-169) TaxID=574566 RepID=I0YNT0_COCSC|nr:hypothetical protein COCSUDRAFT_34025 [Coccomyxa subellipsoidea C-169]EIE20049.1 hypothetical protein COCSUDRAFT_34025 [Coccomyxa subellipsoidea C-169]|eukprot:XP_005644593.1 hypothetical protein COCSUDRAFT_34025 [Coccomyxa subellipsoidea C-169]
MVSSILYIPPMVAEGTREVCLQMIITCIDGIIGQPAHPVTFLLVRQMLVLYREACCALLD